MYVGGYLWMCSCDAEALEVGIRGEMPVSSGWLVCLALANTTMGEAVEMEGLMSTRVCC